MDLKSIQERFIHFAEFECKGNSKLYYRLSLQISEDNDLLKIATNTKTGQPIPNIFFAAVHYLLLKNKNESLAEYYPSIKKLPIEEIPFSLFNTFCKKYEVDIIKIISTSIVQTNVINRCSYLMPIFSKIIADENKPTTIIDIGTSAGFTLNFDKYEYWYNSNKYFGDSKVVNRCHVIDSDIPKIYPILHPINKIGIDQNIIDLNDQDEIDWLKALIWTDQLERFTALEEAIKLIDLNELKFIQDSNIDIFEQEILKVDNTQTLIVYSTHVLYQFTQENKEAFYTMLDKIGQVRDFYFLSVEGIKILLDRYQTKDIVIELTQYKNRQKIIKCIAETNGHGNWIRWK